MRNRADGAEVTQRQQRAGPSGHQRHCAFGQRGKTVAADVVRHLEGVPGQSVEEFPFQGFARGEGNRMHDAVKVTPFAFECCKQGVNLLILGHVAGQHRNLAEVGGKFFDAFADVFTLIGERQLRAFPARGLGDAVGNRAVGQQAGDQDFLVLQESHGVPLP